MRRVISTLSWAALTLLLPVVALADTPPKAVSDMLQFLAGTWEVRIKGNNDVPPETQSAELAAGGRVLISKGKQLAADYDSVEILAWDAAQKKLTWDWYNSNGSHGRGEGDVVGGEFKRNVRAVDEEGNAFSGSVVTKKIDDDTAETVFEIKVGDNLMSFTVVGKRQK
ncbi:MAG: DUF1579 domain-containing protein [Pirellulaceae bacterium]|nr:DUF1579 domain-containing protein [Pirellulaceae bacterium]